MLRASMRVGSRAATDTMRGTFRLWNYFTIGFCAIIGTGWVLFVGDWMVIGGGPIPAIAGHLFGAMLLVPVAAAFGELASSRPIPGGIIEYVGRTLGTGPARLTGWIFLLANGIGCPWESLAISVLVQDVLASFPGMSFLRSVRLHTILGSDVYLWPALIALGLSAAVIALNFRGTSSAVGLQALLTVLSLVGMLAVLSVAVVVGNPDNALPTFAHVTQAGGSMSTTQARDLLQGVASVVAVTPFFYAGFETIALHAEDAAEGLNWNKFGKVIILVLLASSGLYIVSVYSFGTMMPWRAFVSHPNPAFWCLASISLPVCLVLTVVSVLGTLGPMNSFFGASARLMVAMGRVGQLPGGFTRIDRETGVPRRASWVMAAATLVGPLLGRNALAPLMNASSFGFAFAYLVACLACIRMRLQEPELPRPYRAPFGWAGMTAAIGSVAFVLLLLVFPGSPAALAPLEWAVVVAWVLLGAVVSLLARRRRP